MRLPEKPISLYLQSVAPPLPQRELQKLHELFCAYIYEVSQPSHFNVERGTESEAIVQEATRNGIPREEIELTLYLLEKDYAKPKRGKPLPPLLQDYLPRVLLLTSVEDLPWQKDIRAIGVETRNLMARHLNQYTYKHEVGPHFSDLDDLLLYILDSNSLTTHQQETDALWHTFVMEGLHRKRMHPKHLWDLGNFVNDLTLEQLDFMQQFTVADCPVTRFYTTVKTLEEMVLRQEDPLKEHLLDHMKPLLETAESYKLLATYFRFRHGWLSKELTTCISQESL